MEENINNVEAADWKIRAETEVFILMLEQAEEDRKGDWNIID